jgi:hypothetical protein
MMILLILGADLHLLMVKTPVLLLGSVPQYFFVTRLVIQFCCVLSIIFVIL